MREKLDDPAYSGYFYIALFLDFDIESAPWALKPECNPGIVGSPHTIFPAVRTPYYTTRAVVSLGLVSDLFLRVAPPASASGTLERHAVRS